MATAHVDDGEDVVDLLSYLEGLRDQISNDLFNPFQKVEEKINKCCRRWKEQLEIEKQQLIENLQLSELYDRLNSDDNHFSSETIKSDIEYFKNIPESVLRSTSNVTTNDNFDKILQYDEFILQDISQQSVYNSSDEVIDEQTIRRGEDNDEDGNRPTIRNSNAVGNRLSVTRRSVLSLGRQVSTSQEENVKPFSDLINQVPDLEKPPQQREDKTATDTGYHEVAFHKHKAIDRNWIDILLFPNYYLVVIQKKQADRINEWLNKYSTEGNGEVISYLSLPGAGKMCKVSEKDIVAVLQTGRKTIAVVKTSRLLNDKMELMYRINIGEPYNAITCFNIFDPTLSSGAELHVQLKFAAVFSVARNGKMQEEVDTLSSIQQQKFVKNYNCKKTSIYKKSGLNNISAITKDKIIVTSVDSVTCINSRGSLFWSLSMPARVTDICCFGGCVFVCLQDKGHIVKIENQRDRGVIIDNNVLRSELIKPSQVSVCGKEMLTREFKLEEFTSLVILRILVV